MRVTILDAAERDLEDGYRFYERQSPGLGSYFFDSLYSDIDSLSYFDGIHSLVFGYHRLLSKRFPFAIYYKIVKGPTFGSGCTRLSPESKLDKTKTDEGADLGALHV